MKLSKMHIALIATVVIAAMVLNGCQSIRRFSHTPQPWSGRMNYKPKPPTYDSSKKTVFVMADPELTQIFDMLAPFHLFNASEKANVYIVAKESTPILVGRDLFVLPQLTFDEVDSMKLIADVIVVPALSKRTDQQDPTIITWIKRHFTPNTKMLAVCDGSATAAATGLYDGKAITTHASDYERVKAHFSKPFWVQNVSVTKAGNLFSTAGVSNAVDGSLVVIEELFGSETMQKVAKQIRYPHNDIKIAHESIALSKNNKFQVVKKIFLKKNKNIGVLLKEGVNEFEMASIVDTYARTFPRSCKAIMPSDKAVTTQYGLTILSTDSSGVGKLNDLYVPAPGTISPSEALAYKKVRIIKNDPKIYAFDNYRENIASQYGREFAKFVMISLDYN